MTDFIFPLPSKHTSLGCAQILRKMSSMLLLDPKNRYYRSIQTTHRTPLRIFYFRSSKMRMHQLPDSPLQQNGEVLAITMRSCNLFVRLGFSLHRSFICLLLTLNGEVPFTGCSKMRRCHLLGFPFTGMGRCHSFGFLLHWNGEVPCTGLSASSFTPQIVMGMESSPKMGKYQRHDYPLLQNLEFISAGLPHHSGIARNFFLPSCQDVLWRYMTGMMKRNICVIIRAIDGPSASPGT